MQIYDHQNNATVTSFLHLDWLIEVVNFFQCAFTFNIYSMVLIHIGYPYSLDCQTYICTFLIMKWTYRFTMLYITISVSYESIFTVTVSHMVILLPSSSLTTSTKSNVLSSSSVPISIWKWISTTSSLDSITSIKKSPCFGKCMAFSIPTDVRIHIVCSGWDFECINY